MTQDLYYVDSGYLTPDAGYYVYTADAEAAVSSAATMAVTAGVIKDCVSTITCVSTVTAVISHIHGADLVAFSNAAIATQINVIRDNNVALTSVFSAAIDAVRGIYVSAQADAVASIAIANSRVRFTEAAHSAAFSLAADVSLVPGGTVQEADATLTSTTSLTTSIDKFVGVSATISSTTAASIDVVRNRFAASELTSSTTLTAEVSSGIEVSANISATANLTASANITKETSVSISSAFTPTLTVDVFKNSFAVLDSQSSLTVNAVKNCQLESSQVALASQFTQGQRLRFGSASISSQSIVIATVGVVKEFASSQNSLFITDVSANRTRDFASAVSGAFTPTLIVDVVKNSFAVLDSQFTLTSTVDTTKVVSASISSTTILTAIAGNIKLFASNQTSTSSIVLNADEYSVGRHDFEYYGNSIPVETPTKFGKGSIKLGGTFNAGLNQWSRINITGPTDFNIASTESSVLATGRLGQFGIAFWYYPTNTSSNATIIDALSSSEGWFVRQTTDDINLILDDGTNSNTYTTSGSLLNQNDWNYVVITRKYDNTTDKGRVVIAVNGTVGHNSTTIYDNYAAPAILPHLGTNLIGGQSAGAISYIENLHFVNADYIDWTAGVPTTELITPTANTKLLTISRYGLTLDLSGAQTESAAALFASAGTLTATISGPVKASAALVSSSTLVAQVNKTGEINLLAFSNAAVSTIAERIRSAESAQASEFTQIAVASRTRAVDSAQASEFTQSATVVKTVSPTVTTDAIFSELAAVARTGAGFVQLDVQATMATTAIKTTDITAPISSEFAQTTVAVKSTVSSAALSSATALDSTITRIRNQVLVYAVNSQLAAIVGEIEQFSIDLTAVSILSCETGGIREAFANLSSQASVDATILRIKDGSSSLASEFTQTANTANSKTLSASATLAAEATVTADVGTIKQSAITTDAIFTELVAVAKTGQGFITLDSPATLSAVITKTSGASADIASQATVVAVIGKLQTANSAISSTATFTATGTFVTTASANFSVAYTLVCNVVKTASAISLEASAGTLTADVVANKRATAQLSVLAFELALGSKTQSAQANLTAAASVQARVGGTFGFQSAMQGFAAEVIVADIIHIDAKLTWMIFAEDREYSIQVENRTYSIVEEDRDYSIVNENREYAVTRELLTTELQGV